jgi:spermidine synthase
MQFTHPDLRARPLLYYASLTGIGLAMRQRDERTPSKVGVIGLGTGTLAAFGREGDRFLFYEIDPDVTRIARDEGWFSYLGDSAAEVSVIHGDARLSLESQLREGGPQGFDFLVHLLTVEAFQLYHRHLRPGGALVVNVASVHLRLAPLVFRLGASVGMHAVEIVSELRVAKVSSGARWVVLSHDAAYIESLAAAVRGGREALGLRPRALRVIHPDPAALARIPLWRDDYSDLFSILKPVSWWLVGTKSR